MARPRAHPARSSSRHGTSAGTSPCAELGSADRRARAAPHRPQSTPAPAPGRSAAPDARSTAPHEPPHHCFCPPAPFQRSPARPPPLAGRRPALYLAVAAAGALMVNVLTAGEPAARADAQPTSVSIAAQLGVPAAETRGVRGRRPPARAAGRQPQPSGEPTDGRRPGAGRRGPGRATGGPPPRRPPAAAAEQAAAAEAAARRPPSRPPPPGRRRAGRRARGSRRRGRAAPAPSRTTP